MRKLLWIFLFVVGACGTLKAQSCPVMPPGFLCVTQQAGNRMEQIIRESQAKDEKIVVLQDALIEKDKIIADNKAVAALNIADLKAANHKTEAELALKTGQLIGAEANSVRQLAVIDVLLKNVRPKKIGLINF